MRGVVALRWAQAVAVSTSGGGGGGGGGWRTSASVVRVGRTRVTVATTTTTTTKTKTTATSRTTASALTMSNLSDVLDTSAANHFSAADFALALQTSVLGRYFLYRPVCESTQDVAKRESHESAPTGTLVLAEQQTRGRGRIEGRVWQSSPTGNLYFTLVLRPNRVQDLPKINFALPLSVCMAMRAAGVADACVKWPNDVWIGGKKASGFLVDVDIVQDHITVAAGIGINVNQDMSTSADSDVRSHSTSIYTALGNRAISREVFLASVLNRLEPMLVLSFVDVLRLYREHDCLIGRSLMVMPARREQTAEYYAATAVDLTEDGYLVVQRASDGKRVVLVSEEVSVRLN